MENDRNYRPIRNTFDRTVYSLCMEIDGLKEDVYYWKTKYEEEIKRNNDMINNNLKNAQQDLANVLLFAMSVRDDENGNLIIDKDDRKMLADRYRENEKEVEVDSNDIDIDDQLDSWYDVMAYTR